MSVEKRRQAGTRSKSRPAIEPIRKSQDAEVNSDFIRYPINKVVGIIDNIRDAQAALHDLRAAGFMAAQITVLTGEEGTHRIDVRGDQHGPLAHIVRSIQKVLGDYELKDAARYEHEMLAGHFGIGVTARYQEDRDKVLQILKSHNGHFINFYSPWTTEELEP
jgi:hypothetical protein